LIIAPYFCTGSIYGSEQLVFFRAERMIAANKQNVFAKCLNFRIADDLTFDSQCDF